MNQTARHKAQKSVLSLLMAILLTAMAQLPSFARAQDPRLCIRALQNAPSQSLESLDSLRTSLLNTYIDSLAIALMEQGQKPVAVRLKFAKAGILSDLNHTALTSQKDLLSELVKAAMLRVESSDEEKKLILQAEKEVDTFLDLSEKSFFTPIEVASFSNVQEELQFSFGYSDDSLSREIGQTRWSGVEDYVENRLGPLAAMAQKLTKNDRLIISNIPIQFLSPFFGPGDNITMLNLPLASYQKEIYWVTHPNHRQTLFITGFNGSFYLQHFEALLRRRLLTRSDSIPIVRIESPKRYDQKSTHLLQFIEQHSGDFSAVTAMAIGYTNAVHRQFLKYLVKEINSPTQTSWSANIYALPNGETLALLKGEFGTHGEILGNQVAKALTALPHLKKFFFGGSGGALKSTEPYGLKFPYFIETKDGQVPNLFKDASWNFGHFSIETPLLETPKLLESKLSQDLGTVDMEVSTLASVLHQRGLELGAAILVTDYPLSRRVFQGVQLGEQDFQAKHKARKAFAEAIERTLLGDSRILSQPIELKTKKSLDELSQKYLQYINDSIRWPLTKTEDTLLKKYRELPWRTVIRMSPGRLYWLLNDQVLLSTKQVSNFYQEPGTPFTPLSEENMYGAYDYVFAQYGLNLGHPQYGEVVVELKTDVPFKRGWATPFSGWWAEKKTKTTHEGLNYFSSRIVNGKDLKELITMRWISYVQKLSAKEQKELLDATPEELINACRKLSCEKMEVKIPSFIDLDEIQRVYLPESLKDAFAESLEQEHIEVILLPATSN